MGIGQKLKDFYASLEDGYYGFLDWLDGKGIPVYGIVDKIDAAFPSFALLLIILLAIIVCGLYFFVIAAAPADVTLTIKVTDTDGNPLDGATIELSDGKTTQGAITKSGIAMLQVAPGAMLSLSITSEGFERQEDGFPAQRTSFSKNYALVRAAAVPSRYTVIFKDNSGEKIEGKKIVARLSCSNASVTPDPETVEDTDMDGEIDVEMPKNCGVFGLTVIGPSDFKSNYFPLKNSISEVFLEAAELGAGNITVKLEEAETGRMLFDIHATAIAYKEGDEIKSSASKAASIAIEELPVGKYNIVVQDDDSVYGSVTIEDIMVMAKQTKTVTASLSKSVKGRVVATVVDLNTGAAVMNAELLLRGLDGTEIAKKSGDENTNSFEFPILDDRQMLLVASAPDYLPTEIQASIHDNNGAFTVQLEQMNEFNSGKVLVKAIDEEGKPVENARVHLMYDETKTIAPYGAKATDANGVAHFAGIRPGVYYGFAEKGSASGTGAARQTFVYPPTVLEVRMNIGNATVHISAVDEDGIPITSGAEAEIRTGTGEKLGILPLTGGMADYILKADKRIYVVVRHADFQAFQSETFLLYKDVTTNIVAALPSRFLTGGPKAVFLGAFSLQNERVEQLTAGNDYLMKIQLRIPQDATDWREAGLHFRVGATDRTVNDNLEIKEINVAGASFIKGTRFNPPSGQETDLATQNLTEGSAKWVNITWTSPEPMIYNAAILVRVKREATASSALPMFYRAFARTTENKILRDPVDESLGQAFETTLKQGLYAKTYDLVDFFEGAEKECEGNFCYVFRVLDTAEGLYLSERPYSLTIGQDYNLSFTITNISLSDYSGGRFTAENMIDARSVDELLFKQYSVTNASAQTFALVNPPSPKIEQIDSGDLLQNKSISGSIAFKPKTLNSSVLRFRVIHQGTEVAKKDLELAIVSEKKMDIEALPETIAAFIATDLNVKATDDETGVPLGDATIRITKQLVDYSTTVQEAKTNAEGNAFFQIPASSPGTKLTIEAFKRGYSSMPIVRVIDTNVLRVYPLPVTGTLKTPNRLEDAPQSEVSNAIAADITVKSTRLSGNFRGLLDEAKMLNYLVGQWKGREFKVGQTESLQLVKFALNPNVSISSNKALPGFLVMEMENKALHAVWPVFIPIVAQINLGGLPDNAPCIVIDNSEWLDTTVNNTATFSFTVTNNCKADGKNVSLGNLKAKLKWNGDAIGNIDLSLSDIEDPTSSTVESLQSDTWTTMFENIKPGATYYGVATFTPKSGKLGKTANFSILIDSETMTESGAKFVGANKEIRAEILITNLEQCIAYEPQPDEGITVEQGSTGASTSSAYYPYSTYYPTSTYSAGTEDSFEINIKDCGGMEISFQLCRNDPNCRGGASEGGISVSPLEFTLTRQNPSKTIKVKPQAIPGLYGIGISAKVKGRAFKEVAIFDALVEPSSDNQFFLDKYSFVIKGTGSKDSAVLTNRRLSETVAVEASICDMGAAGAAGGGNSPGGGGKGGGGKLPGLGALGGLLKGLQDLLRQEAARKAMEEANKDAIEKVKNAQINAKEMEDKAKELKDKTKEVADKIKKQGTDEVKRLKGDKDKPGSVANLNDNISKVSNDEVSKEVCKKQIESMTKSKEAISKNLDGQESSLQSAFDKLVGKSAADGVFGTKIKPNVDVVVKNVADAKKSVEEGMKAIYDRIEQGIFDATMGMNRNQYGGTYPYGSIRQMGKESINAQSGSEIFFAEPTAKANPDWGPAATYIEKAGESVEPKATDADDAALKATMDGKEEFNKGAYDAIKAMQDKTKSIGDYVSNCNDDLTDELLKPTITQDRKQKIEAARDKLVNLANSANKLNAELEKSGTNILGIGLPNSSIGQLDSLEDKLSKSQDDLKNLKKDMLAGKVGADALKNKNNELTNINKFHNPFDKLLTLMLPALQGAAQGAALGSALGGGGSGGGGPGAGGGGGTPAACEIQAQGDMMDYITNLAGGDAVGLAMDNSGIRAEFDLNDAKYFGTFETQTVGVVFTNQGIASDRPTYSVLNVQATRHHHANPTQIAQGNSNFGQFNIPDASVETVSEKFHLKFKTKDVVEVIPPADANVVSCTMGALVGRTGAGALPRVKLSWSWNDTTGISKDSCLASNPNYVYCDATQFAIMFSKRLHILDEWLRLNRDLLKCPPNTLEPLLDQIVGGLGSHKVTPGKLGLQSISALPGSNSASITVDINNDSSQTLTPNIKVVLTPPSGITVSSNVCSQTPTVNAKSFVQISCQFSGLARSNELYTARAFIDDPTFNPIFDSNSSMVTTFSLGETIDRASYCWTWKATTPIENKPILEWFAESSPVQWTAEIPNMKALHSYISYEAYLMQDGYSEDFKKDFSDYFTRIKFFDPPSYFHKDADGKSLNKYFESKPAKLNFFKDMTDSTELSSAGLYRIDLNIFFPQNWELFDATTKAPNAQLNVLLKLLKEPSPNSPFYSLPVDGEVGLQGNLLQREGYGSAFNVPEGENVVVSRSEQVKAMDSTGSNAVHIVNIKNRKSLKELNGIASMRGFMLNIERGFEFNEKNLVFSPAYATPLLLRVEHGVSSEPFSAYYSLRQAQVPQVVGNTLTYWSGAGACRDFSGDLVTSVFDNKPDRKAVAGDKIQNWQGAYAIDWLGATKGGNVWLKTILYTPTDSMHSLNSEANFVQFRTPDDALGSAVNLTGISSMPYNRRGNADEDRVSSIEDLFNLVKQEKVCITNTGIKASFWWNPKAVFDQKAGGTSITDLERGLVAGQGCIG